MMDSLSLPREQGIRGNLPLHYAARRKHKKVIQYFFKKYGTSTPNLFYTNGSSNLSPMSYIEKHLSRDKAFLLATTN